MATVLGCCCWGRPLKMLQEVLAAKGTAQADQRCQFLREQEEEVGPYHQEEGVESRQRQEGGGLSLP